MTTHVPDTVYTLEEWSDLQTFVPLPDLADSVRSLDRARLGKQRLETLQILNALSGKRPGWFSHPAVRMWAGHEQALITYGLMCCVRWRAMGYVDHTAQLIIAHESHFGHRARATRSGVDERLVPSWLGDEKMHRSHRERLLLKELFRDEPVHYAAQWPELASVLKSRVDRGLINSEGDIEYVWPVGPWSTRGRSVPSRADLADELRRLEESSRGVSGEGED